MMKRISICFLCPMKQSFSRTVKGSLEKLLILALIYLTEYWSTRFELGTTLNVLLMGSFSLLWMLQILQPFHSLQNNTQWIVQNQRNRSLRKFPSRNHLTVINRNSWSFITNLVTFSFQLWLHGQKRAESRRNLQNSSISSQFACLAFFGTAHHKPWHSKGSKGSSEN